MDDQSLKLPENAQRELAAGEEYKPILPAEKMTLYINCRPVYASGLPSDVSPARSQQVRDAVREVINRLAGTEVSPEVLSRSKATLISRLESTQSRTDLLRDRVLDRNSLGRDVSASYKERIKTVKAPELKAVFADLDGCKCEFTVQ